MDSNQEILLSRDTPAVRIPSGDKITLLEGSRVYITQSLGGTYTVASEQGLARIADTDADALGIDLAQKAMPEAAPKYEGEVDAEKVWEQLKNVYDPEIPVNIVDLGLVY